MNLLKERSRVTAEIIGKLMKEGGRDPENSLEAARKTKFFDAIPAGKLGMDPMKRLSCK